MKTVAQGAINWLIASIIAGLIAWVVLADQVRDKKPCAERACYQALNARVEKIEVEMRLRTADRYTGNDAERDRAMIMREIHNVRKECLARMDTRM